MEKQIQIALALFMIAFATMSQTPSLFKYQSVVRDDAGAIVANQDVSFEINILTGSANGNSVYTEEHHIATNAYGLANLTIGNGSITSGNSISDIDWGVGLYFLQISVDADGGTDFTVLGASQLLSVPYALHAKTVEIDNVNDADADASNEIQDLILNGSTLSITNNANASDIDLSSLVGTNTDEQILSLDGTNLSVSNGNTVDLSAVQDGFEANTDAQNLSLTGTDLSISGGNNVDLSALQDGVDDADADATNEIQDISLSGTGLSISDGSTVDLSVIQDGFEANTDNQSASEVMINAINGMEASDVQGALEEINSEVSLIDVNDADADATNEIQDLSLVGSTLKITNNVDATEINLAPFSGNNTDEQTLNLDGAVLSITNGNNVDLSSLQDGVDDADSDATNEIQDISLSGTDLSISNGSTIDLSSVQDGFEANTDEQDLDLVGNTLSLTNDNTSVDLGGYLDNTDEQTLSLSGTDLSISGGNNVDLSALQDGVDDADADATNEIQDLSLVGSTLKITNNASASEIDLSPFQGANTDEQTLSLTGTVLAVTNGNNVDLAAIQDGFEANTDEQSLSITGTDLTISGGNTIDLSILQDGVDDADADATNEIQDISLTGTDLSISDGSTLDLSTIQDGFEANTDDQTLSFNGTNLTIQDGNSVDISSLGSLTLPIQTVNSNTTIDNSSKLVRITAQVEVTLPAAPESGQILHVLGGNGGSTINPNGRNFRDGNNFLGSVTLSFTDMVGGQGAVILVFDGFNWNIVSKSGSTGGESQTLSLTGTNLSIADGNTVNLASIQDGVDDADADATNEIQDLNLSGSTLTITNNAGATEIDLSPFAGTNTDEQTLSLSGTDLSVSNGNTVDLATIQDGFEANTDEQDLSLTGTDLSISGGNTIDVSSLQDGFEANTDNQTIDALSLSGTTLSISLEGDNEEAQTVDLSGLSSSNLPVTTVTSATTLDTRSQIVRVLPAAITVTLPIAPVTGQEIYIAPNSSDASINPNGKIIRDEGLTFSNTTTFDDMVDGLGTIGLLYDGSSWRVISKPNKKLSLTGNTLALTHDLNGVDLSSYKEISEVGTNLGIGIGASEDVTTGLENISLGNYSSYTNTTGSDNISIGRSASSSNTIGSGNVSIGRDADLVNEGGSYNTIIGYQAGRTGAGISSGHTKSGSVFIGYRAGYNETNSNRLYIENSNSASPLIYGEFDNDLVEINGAVKISDMLTLTPQASPPSAGSMGDVYMDTDGKLYLHDGSSWRALAFEPE